MNRRAAALSPLLAIAFLCAPQSSRALQHLWDINEVYTNADGSVQFIELFTSSGSQQFLANHRLTSTGAPDFVFPSNSPAPTANHHLLIGTGPIAGVTPDFTLGPNFLTSGPGNVLAFSIWDSIRLDSLPTDGVMSLDAIFNNSNTPTAFEINPQATPTNHAGQTAILPEPSTWMMVAAGILMISSCRVLRRR